MTEFCDLFVICCTEFFNMAPLARIFCNSHILSHMVVPLISEPGAEASRLTLGGK